MTSVLKKDGLEILEFENSEAFRSWLEKHHTTSSGLFIRMYKKASGIKKLEYAEALDEALCFGWIDSIVNKYDDKSYIQKFTPRRARSIWSKINVDKVGRLIKAGRMTSAGMAEVEKAKADGRWDQAYDSPSTMEVPEDFLKLLATHKKGLAFFESLNKTNKFAIAFQLQTAKRPETRARRMQKILKMMELGEKIY